MVGAPAAGAAFVALNAGGTTGAVASTGTLLDEGSADFAAAACGGSGALGPSLRPATRGHATPMAKPTAAMTPTLIHDGRSSAGDGTWNAGGDSAFRENIAPTISTASPNGRKPGTSGERSNSVRDSIAPTSQLI